MALVDGRTRRDESGEVLLVGSSCSSCGATSFPARDLCDECWSETVVIDLPTDGVVYSFSEVHVAPAGLPVPYTIGYVDLPGDVRVLAQLRGEPSSLVLGARVKVDVDTIRTLPDSREVESYVFRTVDGDRA